MTNLNNAFIMLVLYFYAPTHFSYKMKNIFMQKLRYDFNIRCMSETTPIFKGCFCTLKVVFYVVVYIW